MLTRLRLPFLALTATLLWSAVAPAQDLDLNGAWYDPAHSGEGWIVEVLPDGRAVVYWFTYPPGGAAGEQTWIQGQGRLEGRIIRITESIITRGPAFGAAYDPAEMDSEPWGTWTMTFEDCASGTVEFAGPASFGQGGFDIQRLSAIQGSPCGDTGVHDPAASGYSGSWFDPETSGQGVIVEVLGDGTALVYWFTYTPEGEQAWMFGVGGADGPRLEFPEMFMPVGTDFGEQFDPEAVERRPWGAASLTFDTCGRAVFNYRSGIEGWDHGSMKLERLTSLDGHPCELPEPRQFHKGRWLADLPMVPALSEVAVTALAGKAYVAGGFTRSGGSGGSRHALEFSPGTGILELAPLPASRHHAMMAAHGDSLYVLGGYAQDFGSADTVWRYRIGGPERWTRFSTMPAGAGAAAAVSLGDYLYVINKVGFIWRLDPASREWRVIPGPDTTFRDHANAVAFRGEIWWLAGRNFSLSHNTVEIFDPVTETWRAGPSMLYGHSGFAATVLDDHIFVAAGEHPGFGNDISTWTLESHAEVYSPAEGKWRGAPPVPTPVHGVNAAALGGRIYLMGGTTIPGATFGAAGIIQVYEPG